MDAFWLIPLAIVVVAFLWGFYAYMKKQPLSPSKPDVLVDKPADKPDVDEAELKRDWEKRPCGNYLEWLAEKDKQDKVRS